MKKEFYLPAVALLLMVASCNTKKEVTQANGIDVTNLDTTVLPSTDFYRFACGGWMQKHPLTDEYARFGSFDMLAENNREQLKTLIEELAAKTSAVGSIPQKIGDFYNLAMDSIKLNADGIAPIQSDLDWIAGIRDNKELSKVVAEMRRKGYSPYFGVYVTADDKNSSMNIVHTYQGGYGMGERDYYLDQDENAVNIRNQYAAHIVKKFELAGYTPEQAQKASTSVLAIETRLAKVAYDRVKARNPHANYHKMSVADLKKEVSGVDWDVYFTTLGLKDLQDLNVAQPEIVKESAELWNNTPLEEQKYYLQWNVINNAALYLSDAMAVEDFEFYGKTLSGKKEMQPRWKRAVSSVDGALGEAVGQMYTEKYFPAAAKERMTALVGNLKSALGERIQGLEWMGEETKAKAMEKLGTIYVKVGYPDVWRDYSALEIKNDSYWENIVRSSAFEFDYMIAKAGKPVDKTEWLMTPQTVNAYYNPATNEICFPAGILQYPFFDMSADDAFNYGAIGVVIGHEMTHGFDDQGRQYDKDGNLKEWWTAEDAKNFEARAQILVNHFDSIEVLPGLNANGRFTLGENIADHGGVQVSYTAFQKAMEQAPLAVADGFTPNQRFFLAYANVWAGNVRDEQIRLLTKSDPHSLGKWRVNGALPHIGAWYEAFDVQEGNPMYLAPELRASIW